MANTPVRQYIGARYVPIFADPAEWDNTRTYEPLTIVLHEGNSYTSRQYVPAGIDIDNTEYWALTGNYNSQIEAYRQTAQNALELAQTNETSITDINASLKALHANGVENATLVYNANAMDIRKLGCVENDETQDCGALINTYLTDHPTAAIYVPNGVWYTKSTITLNGEQTMICDGFIRLGTGYILTDNTMIALDGGDATLSSDMTKGKTFKINVDGNMQNVNGISVKGYFASTFILESIRAMGIAIRTISRNIENYFNIRFYGGYNNEYAQIGFQTADSDNDNRADVIGRNAMIGIDNQASYWFYGYIHVWGCDEGIRLQSATYTAIDKYYPDYTTTAISCQNTPSAHIYINQIISILNGTAHLIGDNTLNNLILHAQYVYIPNGYKQLFAVDPAGKLGNYDIKTFNDNNVISIELDDLNNFTDIEQFIQKYGYIQSNSILPNITVQWPTSGSDYTYDTFKNTQYGINLKNLNYHISRDTEYLWGRSTIYVTKTIENVNYPQRVYFNITQNNTFYAQIQGIVTGITPKNMGLVGTIYERTTINDLTIG